MPIQTKLNRPYVMRFVIIGMAAFALSLWSAYDGLVAYPEMNVRYDKFIELQTNGKSDLWADYARSKGWPVEQPATRKSDFDIRVQFIQMGICAFFGVAAFAWLGWLRSKAAGADNEGLIIKDKKIPFDSITKLDKSRWEAKGIVTLTYQEGGAEKTLTLDDWYYAGTEPLLIHIQSHATGAQIETSAPRKA